MNYNFFLIFFAGFHFVFFLTGLIKYFYNRINVLLFFAATNLAIFLNKIFTYIDFPFTNYFTDSIGNFIGIFFYIFLLYFFRINKKSITYKIIVFFIVYLIILNIVEKLNFSTIYFNQFKNLYVQIGNLSDFFVIFSLIVYLIKSKQNVNVYIFYGIVLQFTVSIIYAISSIYIHNIDRSKALLILSIINVINTFLFFISIFREEFQITRQNQLKIMEHQNVLLQKELEKQMMIMKERERISQDMHDDIGATLSSLQINSVVAHKMMEKEKVSEVKEILKNIEKQSKKLSENMGDIVWSLKPNQDAFMTLSTRIKNFASEVLGKTEINYFIEIHQEIDREIIDFGVKKNIVLITKEALNNAAKYSKATNVFVNFVKNENEYVLEIKDNGIGFNENERKGNGIGNMKKRCEEIGGFFQIFTNNGTHIKIILPIIRD